MTCKLHIPIFYNPVTCVTTCACGAVQVRDDEKANRRGPRDRS